MLQTTVKCTMFFCFFNISQLSRVIENIIIPTLPHYDVDCVNSSSLFGVYSSLLIKVNVFFLCLPSSLIGYILELPGISLDACVRWRDWPRPPRSVEEHWKVLVQTCDDEEPPEVSAGILVGAQRRTTCSQQRDKHSKTTNSRGSRWSKAWAEHTPLSDQWAPQFYRSAVCHNTVCFYLWLLLSTNVFTSVHNEQWVAGCFSHFKDKEVTQHVPL